MSRNKPLEQYLSEMIRIPTVSFTPERYHIAEYRDYLKREFPHLFAAMKLRMFDESMLLEWEGTDPALRPIVITGHMDVVDADPSEWKHPPFGGEIHDGEIWGRGALDMKDSQCALSYALDECCEAGFRPQRTVYVYYSSDEEVSSNATHKVTAWMREQGIRPEAVFDEGGTITEDHLGLIPGKCAILGVADRASLTYEVTAEGGGGWASNPKPGSPLGRLAAFMVELEQHPPFPHELQPEERIALRRVAGYLSGEKAAQVLAAAEETDPDYPLLRALCDDAEARLGPTVAFTKIHGSDYADVTPDKATLTLNVRVCSRSQEAVTTPILEALAARFDLKIALTDDCAAARVTSVDSWAYRYVEETLHTVWPDLPVVPFVLGGETDSRVFLEAVDDAIRFHPMHQLPEQGETCHGPNERVNVEALYGAVDYYRVFLRGL